MTNERMSPQEKDKKYGPVFTLMVTARQAHSDLTKAKKTNASQEAIDAAKAAANTADAAVKQAQESYELDDVRLLLSYAGRAIIMDALVPNGNGGFKWDAQKSRWLAKTLMSVLDDRHLVREDKDKAKRRPSLAEQRLNGLEAFIDAFDALGLVPKFGMNDKAVRFILDRLNSKVRDLAKSENRSAREEANRLNVIAGRLKAAVPHSWLQERKPYVAKPATMEDSLPEGSREALEEHVATELETVPLSGEGSGRKRKKK
jgi:hypothetical protein